MSNYEVHTGVIDAPTSDSPGSATVPPDRSPDVPVQLGTHFFRQRYLFAFATQAELLQYVRTQSSDADAKRQAEIMEAWAGLQERVAHLLQTEAEVADTIKLTAIPQEYRTTLEGFAADPLFQKSFSTLPTGFGLVEIDKLVAAQRTVNLEYVERLVALLPPEPSMGDLLEVCVSPKRNVFSSPNSDIRFLGAFVKPLDAEDLGYAVMGGIPAAAVIAFVGYGAAPVNVLQVGRRVVLNNGFHRVYALRSRGVTQIPVVIQQVRNPFLEFPPGIAGLPKEYLLNVARPVLMKDFFEPDFAITLQVKDRIKTVTIAMNVGQHDVPA